MNKVDIDIRKEEITGGVHRDLKHDSAHKHVTGEADYIEDEGTPTGRRELWVGLLEANWLIRQGQNLKLTAEFFEPDRDVDEDEQNRFSLLWEYAPMAFLQLRTGVRAYVGIPQNSFQTRTEAFVKLHGYF